MNMCTYVQMHVLYTHACLHAYIYSRIGMHTSTHVHDTYTDPVTVAVAMVQYSVMTYLSQEVDTAETFRSVCSKTEIKGQTTYTCCVWNKLHVLEFGNTSIIIKTRVIRTIILRIVYIITYYSIIISSKMWLVLMYEQPCFFMSSLHNIRIQHYHWLSSASAIFVFKILVWCNYCH